MAKAVLKSLDGLPDALRAEYVERDGEFHLKVDGDPHGYVSGDKHAELNSKVSEFRSNNIKLMKERDTLREAVANFDGVDAGEYRTLKAKIKELEDKGAGTGDAKAQIEAAVRSAISPLNTELEALKTRNKLSEEREAAANKAAARAQLGNQLTAIGMKLGVEEKLLPDFLRRGTDVFSIEDNSVVAKNGDTPLFSRLHAGEPLGMEEWATDLAQQVPSFFKPSKGAGAGGGGNSNVKRIIANDPFQMGQNLEAIAKGEAVVAP